MVGTFIIAEVGVNHNGDICLAKRLIDEAAKAGCDAVKFQSFKASRLVTGKARQAEYQKQNIGKDGDTQLEMLKRFELTEDDFRQLRDFSESRNIEFLSTPFDEESLNELERLEVRRYKLSSGDLTNKPLIQKVAKTGKPIILSTGMATLAEVDEALRWCDEVGAGDVSLLHCTSAYPTNYDDVNLLAMDTLRDAFKRPVGYSDHTLGIEIPIMAVARGARIIEKHITLSCDMEGPDHRASLEVARLSEMVSGIRHVESAFGSSEKKPNDSELATAQIVRKSVVSTRALKPGDVITSDDITVKRPADGIPPAWMDKLPGCLVVRDIPDDTPIKWTDVSYECQE